MDEILKYFSSPSNALMFLLLNTLMENMTYNTPTNIQHTTPIDNMITILPYQEFIDDTNNANNPNNSNTPNNSNNPQSVCPITLEPFNTKSKIARLRCGHYFEYDAIYTWLQYNNTKTCPCCRRDCNSIVERNSNEIKNFINNQEYIEEHIQENSNYILLENPFSTLQNRDVTPHSYIY